LHCLPVPASSATAWERMFMECDKQGRVLWMNERARARLGPVESLFEALPAPDLPDASQLFSSGGEGRRRTLVSSLQCAHRPLRLPVQLVQLLALPERVVISAEVRARASDARPPQQEILGILLQLQSNATRNYFRLVRAQETLANRGRRAKSIGQAVAEALEIERTRIARELHSGAGQNLAAIKMNLELIGMRMPETSEPVRQALERIQQLAEQASAEIRFISQRFHPPDWRHMDLLGAVEWLWNTSGIPERFRGKLDLQPVGSEVPDAVRFTAYRAVQEGLANILHHADATEIKLQLGQRGDDIYVVLEDNGHGFNVQETLHGALAPAMGGIGLRAMRDEIQTLGGRFHMGSAPGGTKMEITLPITENR
jgi:two-component system, NarL family, sensor kinase